MKSMKRLWCWLTRHRWEWQEIGPGLEFAQRIIDGKCFSCLRCGASWRLGR